MRTAVLIVSYQSCADLAACLDALKATGADPACVWVADNASTDGSADMVASRHGGVRLVRNDRNLNYAEATNRLLASVSADYLLLLNPDTRPDFRALAGLLANFEASRRTAAVAPQLAYPDGSVQRSCRRFPDWRTPWRELLACGDVRRSHWRMADFDHRGRRFVEQLMFSCIWISARALAVIGALDARYPLFFNDVEWCFRARVAGFDLLFDPSVTVPHRRGGATATHRWRSLWLSHRAFTRFLFQTRSSTATALLGAAGVWLLYLLRAARAILDATTSRPGDPARR